LIINIMNMIRFCSTVICTNVGKSVSFHFISFFSIIIHFPIMMFHDHVMM